MDPHEQSPPEQPPEQPSIDPLAGIGDPDGSIDPLVDSIRPFHPCPHAIKPKNRHDEVRARKIRDRDPYDSYHWMRRCVKLESFDLQGDPMPNIIMVPGTSPVGIHSEVRRKADELANWMSWFLWNMGGVVSMSNAIDMALRWFIQHPPQFEWMRGYVARWLHEHGRGRKATRPDDPRNRYAQLKDMGFNSVEEYEESIKQMEIKKQQDLRLQLEYRDMDYEDIAPMIDKEWIKDGFLKIPRQDRELLGMVRPKSKPPHEST